VQNGGDRREVGHGARVACGGDQNAPNRNDLVWLSRRQAVESDRVIRTFS
jgi:hypothetical protein